MMLKQVFLAALSLASGMAMATSAQAGEPIAWVSVGLPEAAAINDAFSRIMNADPDIGRAVDDMERSTRAAGMPWEAAQLLATAYEVVGRYADARAIRDAHRKRIPQCVFPGEPWPQGLQKLSKAVSVLLINEDHLDATTRANVVEALPLLRSMGFTELAMEALPDASVEKNVSGGQVPDDASSGAYLRDPVAAALVRYAVELGFHLHAYDSPEDYGVREQAQARKLTDIARKSTGRLMVLAGPGHVQLEGQWMGQFLAQDLGRKLYTIDQASGAGADCEGPGDRRLVIRDRDRPGHVLGMKTDAALISPAVAPKPDERATAESWLRLGSLRKPVLITTAQVCPDRPMRCLISARRKDSAPASVPEDRYLARGIWRGYLFVRSGTYEVEGFDDMGRKHFISVVVKP